MTHKANYFKNNQVFKDSFEIILPLFLGTGPAYVLRQATITVKKNRECGASSENMLCAGDKAPDLKDSCQVIEIDYKNIEKKKVYFFFKYSLKIKILKIFFLYFLFFYIFFRSFTTKYDDFKLKKIFIKGDSGGPFFMKSGAYYYLVGIVSWGYDCNGKLKHLKSRLDFLCFLT